MLTIQQELTNIINKITSLHQVCKENDCLEELIIAKRAIESLQIALKDKK